MKQRKNHLVVYCNPNPKSLSAVYRDAIVELTNLAHQQVNVRDLYNIGFHPVAQQAEFDQIRHGILPNDIMVEQDYIQWADMLTFIYPIWWTGMPALMKGYFDRVFTRGFAYTADENSELKGLLFGKKIVIINNMGAPYDYYEKRGMLQSLKQTSDEGIFQFCGMEVLEHRFFGHLDHASKEERGAHINVLKRIYDKLWTGL